MKCLYCNSETSKRDGFCKVDCKTKWRQKEEGYFITVGAVAKARDMSEEDIKLQKRFVKQLGKRKTKKKLSISEGAI